MVKRTKQAEMLLRIETIRKVLISALLVIIFPYHLFSQDTLIVIEKPHKFFIGLGSGLSQSDIFNEGDYSVSELVSANKYSFSGYAEAGYFFSKYFGISSGIRISSFKSILFLDNYQNLLSYIDSENEIYERRVSGTGIIEEQKISYISLPFYLNLRLPFNGTAGFYLQPGIDLSIPLRSSYISNGTFTYTGYYPAYNVLLHDLPAYGFPSNIIIETEGKMLLNPLVINAVVSAGFDFYFFEKTEICVAASYNRSLSNISHYTSIDQFQLSSDAGLINSLMGGSRRATARSLGLTIAFRYYLK